MTAVILIYVTETSIEKISKIRFEIFSIPFRKAFECVDNKTDGTNICIPLKGDESLYITPYSDRVMVTYAITFEDQSDVVLGKVFLQEFNDTRQKHTVQNSPTVIFGKEPPQEMAKYVRAPKTEQFHFLSFGTP